MADTGSPTAGKTYTEAELQAHVGRAQASLQKALNTAKAESEAIKAQLAALSESVQVLQAPEPERPAVQARLKTQREAEDGANAARRAAKIEAAARLAEKNARFGVTFSELMELDTPLAMQEAISEKVEDYVKAIEGKQPQPRDRGAGNPVVLANNEKPHPMDAVRGIITALDQGQGISIPTD